jgi:phosphatidylserine/phosphatidylglycerophosphate/cardiolipin synthase-like enzyme
MAAYTRTFANKEIFPHINSIREAIANNLNLTPEARSLLDDLLERGPHCWDGCQLCVMLERDCNYLPFDQPFLVTNRLTGEIVRILKKMVDSPTEVFPLKIDVENEFLRFISTARNSIDLVSPWLSPEIVKEIIKKAEENELNVRIITTRDIDNKVHAESLKILRETIKYVKTRISQQLHAKGMLVDGVMLLTGSFNFTITGLKSKVENLTVDFSLQGVRNFKKEFDAMWEKSLPLE